MRSFKLSAVLLGVSLWVVGCSSASDTIGGHAEYKKVPPHDWPLVLPPDLRQHQLIENYYPIPKVAKRGQQPAATSIFPPKVRAN